MKKVIDTFELLLMMKRKGSITIDVDGSGKEANARITVKICDFDANEIKKTLRSRVEVTQLAHNQLT